MVVAVYVCLLAATSFALVAPVCARRLAPRAATWALTLGGAVTGATAVLSLLLVALTLALQGPAVTGSNLWAAQEVHERTPVPAIVAGLALALVLLAAGRAVLFWRGYQRAAAEARDLVGGLTDRDDDVSVVDAVEVIAFAVPGEPGEPGRIVITQGLVDQLGPAEREAVVAHERAHLRHHHGRHRIIAGLVASLVPVLRGLPALVELTTERWADEDAAGVCPRATVRAALLRVGVARPVTAAPMGVLGVAESNVLTRVAALEHPRSAPPRPWVVGLATVLTALFAVTAVSATEAVRDTHLLFMQAQQEAAAE